MLETRGLTKSFGSTVVVDRLSFRVQSGEVFGLLGPNGAGKTTTLRMILGLMPPTSGDVIVGGTSVSAAPLEAKRRIGLVSASSGLYPGLTPRETLEYCAALYGLSDQLARVRIAETIDWLNLHEFADRRCGVLSTGQRQRVTLARSVLHDPDVVLMDEPTRGLDIVASQTVFDYLARVRAAGKAIVLCTHQLDEAQRICDRYGLLHGGRLRQSGTLAELRQATGQETLVDMFLAMLRTEHSAEEGAAGCPA